MSMPLRGLGYYRHQFRRYRFRVFSVTKFLKDQSSAFSSSSSQNMYVCADNGASNSAGSGRGGGRSDSFSSLMGCADIS